MYFERCRNNISFLSNHKYLWYILRNEQRIFNSLFKHDYFTFRVLNSIDLFQLCSLHQNLFIYKNVSILCLRTKTSILQRRDFNQLLQNAGGNLQNLKQELTDFNTFTVAIADKDIKPQYYRSAIRSPYLPSVDRPTKIVINRNIRPPYLKPRKYSQISLSQTR